MTREVSVLTAVRIEHVQYLHQAWQSIVEQSLPNDWTIRWYVQEDGKQSELQGFIKSLGSAVADYAASGARGGVAEARNLALARATGDVVVILDADDQLASGSVSRVLATLESGAMWCGFAAIEDCDGLQLRRDGGYSARLSVDGAMPPEASKFVPSEWVRSLQPGSPRSCWEDFGVLPFHPATFATKASIIWDYGGWPGLARDEDTALILAITDDNAGVVSDDVNLIYRRHMEQTSRMVPPNDERIEFIRRIKNRKTQYKSDY